MPYFLSKLFLISGVVPTTIEMLKALGSGFKVIPEFVTAGVSKNRFLSDAAELSHNYAGQVESRVGESLKRRIGIDPNGSTLNYLEKQDNGCRVAMATRFAQMIRNHADLKFEDVPPEIRNNFERKYGINSDDWDELAKYVKKEENDILVPQDFKGELGFKVESMEMSNDLASIATGVKVSADFLRGIPEPLKQVIGMFWSFSFKQMYHGIELRCNTEV